MPRKPSVQADAPTGRLIGYVRVSTDEQAESGQSLAVQQNQLAGWAMQRGEQLNHVVVEAGVSGAVPFNERPEGGKLWVELHKGDVLVAAKLDRVFRSAADCLAVVEAFKARGVSLFLLDLNGGADDVSGNGIARLFLTIVSAFAEFERDRIGERIRATKRAQKAKGEYSGGAAPFGFCYVDRKLQPVPEQQRELRRIRKLAADGLSPRKISADLASRGIRLSHVTIHKLTKAGATREDASSGERPPLPSLEELRRQGFVVLTPSGKGYVMPSAGNATRKPVDSAEALAAPKKPRGKQRRASGRP